MSASDAVGGGDVRWFSVRCLVRHSDLGVYEERVTLWIADALDHAITLAAAETETYCADLDSAEPAGLVQAYEMYDPPGHGREVYSLMRESDLPPDVYVQRFFDTGRERTQ